VTAADLRFVGDGTLVDPGAVDAVEVYATTPRTPRRRLVRITLRSGKVLDLDLPLAKVRPTLDDLGVPLAELEAW
jgi:hypothetical protein